jgi:hypothetical protein
MIPDTEKQKILKEQMPLSDYVNNLFSDSKVIENKKFNQFTVINPYSFKNTLITTNKPVARTEPVIILKKQKNNFTYYKELNNRKIDNLMSKFYEILVCSDDEPYKKKYILYKQKINNKTSLLFGLQNLDTGLILINHGIVEKIFNLTYPEKYLNPILSFFRNERTIQIAIFNFYNFIFPKMEKTNFIKNKIEYKTLMGGGAMDLLVYLKDRIYLYELKYKFSRSNMYKAIGQLENYNGYLMKEIGIKRPIHQIAAGIKKENSNTKQLAHYLERKNRKIQYIDKYFLRFLGISGFAKNKNNKDVNILVS